MGSRPQKDGESPSASISLLPQFRHSRRGSLASLASVNEVDKETLSQALDEIHTSASQTDTFTTFNEFTAPPSSSSLHDNKSIAGELQGGISGLYNRFRASVGNSKDASSIGGEDDPADRLSGRSVLKPSPAPFFLMRVRPASSLIKYSSSASDQTRAEGDRQSSNHSPSSRASVVKPENHDGQGVSNSNVGSALPSGKISQNANLEDIGSTTVKSQRNTTAIQPGSTSIDNVPTTSAALPNSASHKNEQSPSQDLPSKRPLASNKGNTPSSAQSLVHPTSQNHRTTPKLMHHDRFSGVVDTEEHSSSRWRQPPNPATQLTETRLYASAISKDEDKADQNLEVRPDVVDNSLDTSSRPAIHLDQRSVSPNISDETTGYPTQGRKGKPQRIELAARKSMAPPLVSHAESPHPRLSRASSTDTNTDSLNSAPHQIPPRQANGRSTVSNDASSLAQARALPRDPRMMNVFSQSRNKVLNKEYWMKDENARDCFNCGEAFSTFRRKHHCREYILSVSS